MLDDHLRAAQNMSCRHEMHRHLPELDGFMVLEGLRRFPRTVCQTDFHDVQGFTRCQNGLVSGSGMI